jgi:hypothetical protein
MGGGVFMSAPAAAGDRGRGRFSSPAEAMDSLGRKRGCPNGMARIVGGLFQANGAAEN